MTALLTPPAKSVTPPPMRSAVPPSAPPTPFRFTIAQYRQLGATGLFHDLKTMLIDGELYVMGMPNPPHDAGMGFAEEYVRAAFAGMPVHVRSQKGFDIGTRNDPGPDIAVVPGTIADYQKRTPTSALLIVEVADSSLAIDTGRKVELYATADVPDYWVLDLNGRELHVFRDPQAGTYAHYTVMKEADSVAPLAVPGASVRVADLLPAP